MKVWFVLYISLTFKAIMSHFKMSSYFVDSLTKVIYSATPKEIPPLNTANTAHLHDGGIKSGVFVLLYNASLTISSYLLCYLVQMCPYNNDWRIRGS